MRTRFRIPAVVALAAILAGLPLSAAAVTRTVYPGGSIQAAIAASANGDTVVVKGGEYYENIDFLGKAITVRSELGLGSVTLIGGMVLMGPDVPFTGSVVTFASGEGPTSILQGFIITGGTSDYGGGIYIAESSPTIRSCTITGNQAETGGGVYLWGSWQATFVGCTISENFAFWGGGMASDWSAPVLDGCAFQDNVAIGGGGGMALAGYPEYESEATLVNCSFTDNAVLGGFQDVDAGGGILVGDTFTTLTDCTVRGNTAPAGGGMAVLAWEEETYTQVTGSTISGNQAMFAGGGVAVASMGGYPIAGIFHSTVSGNSVGQMGGGLGVFYDAFVAVVGSSLTGNTAEVGGAVYGAMGDGGVAMLSSILSGNTATEFGGAAAADFGNLYFESCFVTGNAAPVVGGIGTWDEGTMTVRGSTLSGNLSRDNDSPGGISGSGYVEDSILWGDSPYEAGGDLTVNRSDVAGWWSGEGSDNYEIYPVFRNPRPAAEAPTTAGDYHLRGVSPCIDQGPDWWDGLTDVDGSPRIMGSSLDTGADEYSPQLMVTSPGAQWIWWEGEEVEILPAGGKYTVRWTAPDSMTRFNLSYSLNGGLSWTTMASGVTGRSYLWSVPKPTANMTNCLVRVRGYNSAGVLKGTDDTDAAFTIGVVSLVSPAGGEVVPRGETYDIVWDSLTRLNPSSVVLAYSTNGGATWKTIVTLPVDPGRYTWNVPLVTSSTCKMRVTLKNSTGGTIGTVTGGLFTIQQLL